jgi:hypothetical protein
MKTSQAKGSEQLSEVESSHRELEKRLKEREWELADVTSMKDARYGPVHSLVNSIVLKHIGSKFIN